MTMEIVLIWLAAGIAMDFSCVSQMAFGYQRLNAKWKEKYPGDVFDITFIEAFKEEYTEAPWWAHVVLILVPPTGLLFLSMPGKEES